MHRDVDPRVNARHEELRANARHEEPELRVYARRVRVDARHVDWATRRRALGNRSRKGVRGLFNRSWVEPYFPFLFLSRTTGTPHTNRFTAN